MKDCTECRLAVFDQRNFDIDHAARDRHMREIFAIPERILTNGGDTGRDRYAFNPFATSECLAHNGFYRLSVDGCRNLDIATPN